jgi:serine/threonine-protein kinase RsbW
LHSPVASEKQRSHNAGVRLSPEADHENQPATEPLRVSDGAVDSPAIGEESTKQPTFREFCFPGDLASVPEARDEIMEFVSERCADEGERIDILVAVQEALANAALHGCGDDPAKRVDCTVTTDADGVTITVRDPGPGFDVAAADPDNYSATTLTHGRGICLIRSLMSEVAFGRGGGEIRMYKQISSE